MSQPSILIIYTGGTIGMKNDPNTGRLQPFDFDWFRSEVPELDQMDVHLDAVSFKRVIDSCDMQPEQWVRLAEIIKEHYDSHDGFIILHGSDTMAYTASALSFMLHGLNKPVILTGAQLPIGTLRTDGRENLITAIEIASAKSPSGQPRVPEVAIYFEYSLYRGNRTHKIDADDFKAFESLNYPLLAKAGVNIKYTDKYIRDVNEESLQPFLAPSQDIALLKMFPGMTQSYVNAILESNVRAVVIESFGSGNAPQHDWLKESIEAAIKRGQLLLNITQCNGGSVKMGKYPASQWMVELGIVSGHDMTTEAAVTKLMVLLGMHSDLDLIKKQLEIPLCGEMTPAIMKDRSTLN